MFASYVTYKDPTSLYSDWKQALYILRIKVNISKRFWQKAVNCTVTAARRRSNYCSLRNWKNIVSVFLFPSTNLQFILYKTAEVSAVPTFMHS